MICETAPLNGAKSEAKRRKQMNVVRLINFANLRGKEEEEEEKHGNSEFNKDVSNVSGNIFYLFPKTEEEEQVKKKKKKEEEEEDEIRRWNLTRL